MLIVVTGLDGSGTSTVAEYLHKHDEGSVLLKTPSIEYIDRNKIDESIHEISPTAHMLYYLSSTVFISDYIKQNYDVENQNVYVVRNLIDTVVSNRVRGVDIDLNYNIFGNEILTPDLTIFVSLDEQIRQKRISERGKSYLDKVLDNEEIRNKFLKEFDRLLDKEKTIIIDNSEDSLEKNINKVFQKNKINNTLNLVYFSC